MSDVTGTVTLDGSAVSGAIVIGINETQQIVEDVTTTDANGDYTLTMTGGDTAHVKVQYDDGNLYNAESKPFIVLTADVTIVEDFERTDPLADYSGTTSAWSIVTDPAYEGSALWTDQQFNAIWRDGSHGFPDITKGSTYRYYVWGSASNTADRLISRTRFAAPDTSNYFEIRHPFNFSGGNIEFYEVVSGSSSFLAGTSGTAWTASAWHAIRIIWDDGTLGGNDGDITIEKYLSGDDPDNSTPDITLSVTSADYNHTATDGNIGFLDDAQAAGESLALDYVIEE